jgi:hypothetical protein
MRKRKKDE